MKAGEEGFLGVPYPDLGDGTVVATTEAENSYLMAGMYIEVEWDMKCGSLARYPAIQAVRMVK
jgi:hypothetical protein